MSKCWVWGVGPRWARVRHGMTLGMYTSTKHDDTANDGMACSMNVTRR